MATKYIFVTGGVVSGLGKGITAASLGRLLKARGYSVTMQKFDPYINVNPGTMSPYQHGEVFVTQDGAETDLDLGHYERFIDENLFSESSVTAGQIFTSVILRERAGGYMGATVQVIPHITDEIKRNIYRMAELSQADFVLCEVGGTVGDIESLPFLEALRQVPTDVGRDNVLYIHVTLLPTLLKDDEPRLTPTQQSVKTLSGLGIQPQILVLRTEKKVSEAMRRELAGSLNVPGSCLIENNTAGSLYEVPLLLEKEGFAQAALSLLSLPDRKPDLADWSGTVERATNTERTVCIALVGKYTKLHDAYLSVTEALKHAGIARGARVDIRWVNSQELESQGAREALRYADGIIVPGGFGTRGTEGMIAAIRYARENRIPYLGICLGMQLCTIEYARNVLGLDAHSTELNPAAAEPVIDILPGHQEDEALGDTLRRGALAVRLAPGSLAHRCYGKGEVLERHRHRYGIGGQYAQPLEDAGLVPSGLSPEGVVEIVELRRKAHPWYVGVQFHPEFLSRPNRAHPLFLGFVGAALDANAVSEAGS